MVLCTGQGHACRNDGTDCRDSARPVPDAALELTDIDGLVTIEPTKGELPWRVVAAGDVDGDGVADLLISSIHGDETRRYVVFGAPNLVDGDLAGAVEDGRGFVIEGAPPEAAAVASFASAADVNNDGLADLVLGGSRKPLTDPARAYVVFGRSGSGAVRLDSIASDGGGLVISGGDSAPGSFGGAIAGVSDVNGDEFDDLLVVMEHGEAQPDAEGDRYVPTTFEIALVLGRGAGTITVGADASSRIVLRPGEGDGTSPQIVGTGDLDGDGRRDFAVADFSAAAGRGRLYLVSAVALDAEQPQTLAEVAAAGLAAIIEGNGSGDGLGGTVADVGDLDGDGLHEVAAAAAGAAQGRGELVVVAGAPTVWAATRSSVDDGAGFVVVGEEVDDALLYAGGGDFDGDLVPDLLVGSHGAGVGFNGAGAIYLLHGSAGVSGGALDPTGVGLTMLVGPQDCGHPGGPIAAVGDVTGDAIDDFAFISQRIDFDTLEPRDGRVYLIPGRSPW